MPRKTYEKQKGNLNRKKTVASTATFINYRQHRFVAELMIDDDPVAAAKRAGYHNGVVGYRLLDPKRYPLVCAEIDVQRKEKEKRVLKTGDDVLRFIHNVMFFEPLKLFEPAPDGGWLITPDGYKNIPPEIGCIIEEVQRREKIVETKHGKVSTVFYWIKFISKSQMTALAAKYQLTEHSSRETTVVQIPWDSLSSRAPTNVDVIENRINNTLASPAPLSLPLPPPKSS